ncbi:phage portal protein [Paenibacillus sp. RUD330]|uniref:phage portal protein n=1 Tax=Paenibacillus sp. RUD330 TaxID=2023772 RepID=UPI00197D3E2E|nr:phage portal protein [Paenibacillus sp. RUD330]
MNNLRIPFLSNWVQRQAAEAVLEERSATLANPDSWLVDWLMDGEPASSGILVNETTALHSTAVFACVRILAETIASLPLQLYQQRKQGGKEVAYSHPLHSILHDSPNEEMTAFVFIETLMGHLATWGNAYAEIEWDGAGRVIGLWPLRPDQTWVNRDANGAIWFHTIIQRTGDAVVLPAYRVLHIPGLGFDGLKGYSPISKQREAIGLTLATEKYGATYFGNGARPGGVIETTRKIGDQAAIDRFRNQWNDMHSGLQKQHRIAILEEGMQYKQIGLPPEDSQFLQTRKFQLGEIARIFRVPPHMIGDLERSTNNNIEHQSIEFVMHTIRPWVVRWEQAIKLKLLTRPERKKYEALFNVNGLMRGDYKSRQEGLNIMRQNGIINANTWLEMEDMNPIDGPEGEAYLVNGNMTPVGATGKGGE